MILGKLLNKDGKVEQYESREAMSFRLEQKED